MWNDFLRIGLWYSQRVRTKIIPYPQKLGYFNFMKHFGFNLLMRSVGSTSSRWTKRITQNIKTFLSEEIWKQDWNLFSLHARAQPSRLWGISISFFEAPLNGSPLNCFIKSRSLLLKHPCTAKVQKSYAESTKSSSQRSWVKSHFKNSIFYNGEPQVSLLSKLSTVTYSQMYRNSQNVYFSVGQLQCTAKVPKSCAGYKMYKPAKLAQRSLWDLNFV